MLFPADIIRKWRVFPEATEFYLLLELALHF